MDHFERLQERVKLVLFGGLLLENALVIGLFWMLALHTNWHLAVVAFVSLSLATVLTVIAAIYLSKIVLEPLRALWLAILHISPSEHGVAAPDTNTLRLGRELVTALAAQVYQLAHASEQLASEEQKRLSDLHYNFVAQRLPLPLVVLDSAETIIFANDTAAQYIGIASEDLIGKNVYMVLDMSFPSEATFDTWLASVKSKNATATNTWERVRLNVRDNHPPRLFDLAAYYNRDNPNQVETMLVLFDHTKQYSQDDQAVSFIALSVHELRTPLTLLRGYIEVFEEELAGKMDAEQANFMQKMKAMAEQLTAFVNNILNVARVDNDQLELRLQSEDWGTTLKSAIDLISLRAKVRGISLQCRLDTTLPPVGIDRLSIREVLNNLIDNAIKYSGDSKVIKIECHLNKEGFVETTVQDFGMGIPASILPNLFTKFYRDHHHRAQIGGTGLGLYLCKAIVEAHGGSIWVKSKEGEGTTFGFTLMPYAKLAETQKADGSLDITRSAQGWIKNHSLYRR